MSAHRHRLSIGLRLGIAALAGFSIGPFSAGAPIPLAPGASARVPAVARDQGPVVATTRTSRRQRRNAARLGTASALRSIRREIEAVGGPLSARQWVRIRRFMVRAVKIPRDRIGQMADAAIIAKRCTPQYRVSDHGPLLMGVHPQGVVLVTSGRRAIGVPWSWLKEVA